MDVTASDRETKQNTQEVMTAFQFRENKTVHTFPACVARQWDTWTDGYKTRNDEHLRTYLNASESRRSSLKMDIIPKVSSFFVLCLSVRLLFC